MATSQFDVNIDPHNFRFGGVVTTDRTRLKAFNAEIQGLSLLGLLIEEVSDFVENTIGNHINETRRLAKLTQAAIHQFRINNNGKMYRLD